MTTWGKIFTTHITGLFSLIYEELPKINNKKNPVEKIMGKECEQTIHRKENINSF